MASTDWLTAQQAAEMLDVKPATLYAYVSRGLLERHPGDTDRRTSRFDRKEVALLAKRTHRGGRAAALEVVVDTEITLIDQGGVFYRGRDATEMARTESFEQVAEWLWQCGYAPWIAPPKAILTGTKAQAGLDGSVRPADRMRVVAAATATTDAFRNDRRPAGVISTARSLIAALVDCLPGRTPAPGLSIAERLWSRLGTRAPQEGELAALNGALGLSADHELAAPTFAARLAASVQADPYLVVLTALSAGGGGLTGGGASAVEDFLLQVAAAPNRDVFLSERLRQRSLIPGFGSPVTRNRDARADALLKMIDQAKCDPERKSIVRGIVDFVSRYEGPAPNLDFSLGAMSAAFELQPGSAEAIFLLARTAGVIAHAMEEYRHKSRFRPRTLYTGPRPTGS